MKGTEKIFLSFLLCVLVVSFFEGGCGKKSQKPPSAIITVVDSLSGAPIEGIKIRLQLDTLRSKTTNNPAVPPSPDTQYTDAYGQVNFTVKYPSSFFAQITSLTDPDTAKKLIQFKKGEVTEVTILY